MEPVKIELRKYRATLRSTRQLCAALDAEISQELGGRVVSGPFEGMKFSGLHYILGFYENQLHEEMQADGPCTFVDIGGGIGYWVAAMLYSGRADRAICFEAAPRKRRVLKKNLAENGVLDKTTILGIAESGFVQEINNYWDGTSPLLFLVDIEGGEYTLLTEEVFDQFSNAKFVIELHDTFTPGLSERDQQLINDAAATHSFRVIDNTKRDISVFYKYVDANGLIADLLMSEQRNGTAKWLILLPKSST